MFGRLRRLPLWSTVVMVHVPIPSGMGEQSAGHVLSVLSRGVLSRGVLSRGVLSRGVLSRGEAAPGIMGLGGLTSRDERCVEWGVAGWLMLGGRLE